MKHETKNNKWNKGWRFFIKKWLWFFVIMIFAIACGAVRISKDSTTMPITTSRPFCSPTIITPEPTYQTPSELLELQAVKHSETN